MKWNIGFSQVLGAVLWFSQIAYSAPPPLPQFTAQEIALHRAEIKNLEALAMQCMENTNNYHNSFFKQNNFSPFFGDSKKDFASLNFEQRVSLISSNLQVNAAQVRQSILGIRGQETGGKDGQMKNMSCIGLVARCLQNAFIATKQQSSWNKLRNYLAAFDYDGTKLQRALRPLGWTTYYWNVNVSRNAEFDKAEVNYSTALKGYHSYRYNEVLRNKKYYGVEIDDQNTLTNFNLNPPAPLRKISFWVGTAHSGYHVFAGLGTRTIEGHAGRGAFDFDIVEAGLFNPLAPSGKPSGQTYKSGIIIVAPGSGTF